MTRTDTNSILVQTRGLTKNTTREVREKTVAIVGYDIPLLLSTRYFATRVTSYLTQYPLPQKRNSQADVSCESITSQQTTHMMFSCPPSKLNRVHANLMQDIEANTKINEKQADIY